MNDNPTETASRRELLWFLILAYGISWLFWLPVTLASLGIVDWVRESPRNWFYDFIYFNQISLGHVFTILGGAGPVTAAVLLTRRYRGAAGVRELWCRAFDWRLPGLKWLIVAGLLPVAYTALSQLSISFVAGVPLEFGTGPLVAKSLGTVLALFVYSCTTMTVFIVCEELGWRGFMLPRLQRKWSALAASIWLAFAWSYWHLPYYLALFFSDAGIGYALVRTFVISVFMILPISVLMTFVFNSTQGSVLAAMLFHGVSNSSSRLFGTGGKVPDRNVETLVELAVLWLLAIFTVLVFGAKNLSRNRRFCCQ